VAYFWLSFLVTAEPAEDCDVLLFQSADKSWVLIDCMNKDGPVYGVGGLAKCIHFLSKSLK
jgi:hypothetical protein